MAHSLKDFVTFRIEGDAGDGIISMGNILAKSIARCGGHVYTFRTYPAEVRGGQSTFQLRAGPEPVHSQGDKVDVFVALNETAFHQHKADLKLKDGVLIHPDVKGVWEGIDAHGAVRYAVDFGRIAKDAVGSPRAKNVVAIGVLAELFGLDPETIKTVLADQFRSKGEKVVAANSRALDAGIAHGQEHITKIDKHRLTFGERTDLLVMSGNEAIAYGALLAGVRFYAGYPITPASEILEWLAKHLPQFGGRVVQSEDEIAALGMCLGASFGGVKAMTATSGPGLSLMSEMIGLGSMAEIPVVIVDVQRGGPSSGMPTKDAQGDLDFAIYGTHGEAPKVVLAPHDVEDCLYQTINAVNIAHRFHIPVIVLSGQSLSHRTETIAPPDPGKMTIYEEKFFEQDGQSEQRFCRYDERAETGTSVRSIPGLAGGEYRATGLEHDDCGLPRFDPYTRERMVARRRRKMHAISKFFHAADRSPQQDATVGLMGWGTTTSIVHKVVRRASNQGLKLTCLCPKILFPLPDQTIREFIKPLKKIFICETNSTRQFAELIKSRYSAELIRGNVEVISITKDTGLPFTAAEVYGPVEEVLSHDRHQETVNL